MRARIIRLEVETAESGMLYATSPDLRGLFIGRRTMDELMIAVPQAIEAILEAQGLHFKAYEAEGGDLPSPLPWVVVPVDERRCA